MEAINDPAPSSVSWVARLVTVQGPPASRLWLITQGEALVSATARPLRVAGYGDPVGLASMLRGGGSPDTTIALSTMRALSASREQFRELVGRPAVRERLVAAMPARRRRR